MCKSKIAFWIFIFLITIPACQPIARPSISATPVVYAAESFLADIAQNIAGDRLQVKALIPAGLDPHAFEPTPQDLVQLEQSQMLILNGCGLEEWMDNLLEGALKDITIIEACKGLTPRPPEAMSEHGDESDPHFWLDPIQVNTYVENIRVGLTEIDPAGAEVYAQNAREYTIALQNLDKHIQTMVTQLPPEKRLLVTNHENLGYFADRYGFKVVGAIIPSVSSGSSPTAQQLAQLVQAMRSLQVNAIFLEVGANAQLADQIASETGIRVVSELYSHSLSDLDGPAPTYLQMMEYNTRVIVDALK